MTNLLILGAGGHAKVVAETAVSIGIYENIAFLDDRYGAKDYTSDVLGHPVIGTLGFALDPICRRNYSSSVVAIGNSLTRLKWMNKLKEVGYNLHSLTHPTAWVSPSSEVGDGTVIFAKSVVQSGAKLGMGVIINTSSSIDHDSYIGDGTHISPGAHLAGSVVVGARTCIGIGVAIKQNISIGDDVIVGAGACVISDLPDKVQVVLNLSFQRLQWQTFLKYLL